MHFDQENHSAQVAVEYTIQGLIRRTCPTLYKITGAYPKPLTPQIWSFVPETVDTPTAGANSHLLFQILNRLQS